MANLSLTSVCNRSCAYCFAGLGPNGRFLRRPDFLKLLDLLDASGIREARLLGGEPTLHPEFSDLAGAALARGFKVQVFSNGLIPEPALAWLESMPEDRGSLLLNLAPPGDRPAAERERVHMTAARLARRASPGVNLYRPGLDLDFVFEWIASLGMAPTVRLGLAHPRLGAGNAHLAPKRYTAVGRELTVFARKAMAQGVRIDLDCGFVPCMFPPEFFDLTGIDAREIGRRCSPIPDILPDLSAAPCFALAPLHSLPVAGAASTAELQERFAAAQEALRPATIFRECVSCDWHAAGNCAGGCLSAALLRTRSAAPVPPPTTDGKSAAAWPRAAARLPGPDAKRWLLPYVDQPPQFWQELAEAQGSSIKAIYFPLPSGRLGSGRPNQPQRFLGDFLRLDGLGKHVLLNPLQARAPLDRIGDAVIEEVATLAEEYGVSGATVTDLRLAERLRRRLPGLELTASTLLEVSEPAQAAALRGLFDVLVPATKVLHRALGDRGVLRELQSAFGGPVRLLLNEGCLPDCVHRSRHFSEMADGRPRPASLCAPMLSAAGWMRLTGAWLLPQHLHWLDDLNLEYKLAGRVTLADPARYRQVSDAYLHRIALGPDQIGAGPASILDPVLLPEAFYRHLLSCGGDCAGCRLCERFARNRSPGQPRALRPPMTAGRFPSSCSGP